MLTINQLCGGGFFSDSHLRVMAPDEPFLFVYTPMRVAARSYTCKGGHMSTWLKNRGAHKQIAMSGSFLFSGHVMYTVRGPRMEFNCRVGRPLRL